MKDNIWHVVPMGDIQPHWDECIIDDDGTPLCKCVCEPTTYKEDAGYIIVHNSFDGREGVEWTNEILSK